MTPKPKITEKLLLDNGYKRFSPSIIDGEFVADMYSKKFTDKKGVKYFIRFDRYLFPDGTIGFSQQVQFNTSSGPCFNVELNDDMHLEDVEQFFENIWRNMNCSYYEEYAK